TGKLSAKAGLDCSLKTLDLFPAAKTPVSPGGILFEPEPPVRAGARSPLPFLHPAMRGMPISDRWSRHGMRNAVLLSCGSPGLVLGRAFEVAVQAGAPNPQYLRGTHAVSLAHLEHALDVQAAHFFEWRSEERRVGKECRDRWV